MLKLRPHHILDIVRNIGTERPITPHEYGHLVHEITPVIIADIDTECMLVVENDSICGPCRMLKENNECIDVLSQLKVPISKQKYNDDLDNRILAVLEINKNTVMTIQDFLKTVNKSLNDIVSICTHPKEDCEQRRKGLTQGLKKLKI